MSFTDELSAAVTLRSVTGDYGECRVQRLDAALAGERTWTVLGADHRPVGPAEEFLEYLRAQRVSPNTVKSYARALALWWQYLEVFGLDWDAVTLEDFGRVPGLAAHRGRPAGGLDRAPARHGSPSRRSPRGCGR